MAMVLRRAWHDTSQLLRGFWSVHRHSHEAEEFFGGVRTYCMFLGYPRSGSTLIGSLLDAHPDIVIAREANALLFVQAGFSRNQIYHLILENSSSGASGAVGKSGYSYGVPNQWQGRVRDLQIMGDKKAAVSTKRLYDFPRLVHRVENALGPDIRFIHVIRNPYDNISTISRRSRISLERAAEFYFSLCKANAYLKSQFGDRILDVKHETFIQDPRAGLDKLCGFLNQDSPCGYLDDCASIVHSSPHQSRHQVDWDPRQIDKVARGIDEIPFLAGYSYAD